MKNLEFFSKLKSQKGVTGVDIVVSISIIAITIAVITSIYINIDLTSKKVERTAGATRIATNILEEIDKMYYEEFITELDRIYNSRNEALYRYITANKYDETNYTYTVEPKKTSQDVKFFNTRIPKGYVVDLKIENAYGTDNRNKYDMVKNIDISIKYSVGEKEENVTISTAKAIEIVDKCNTPIFSKDVFELCDSSIKDRVDSLDIIPIKKSGTDYIRTTLDDPEWYNYENKNWAKIIIDESYCDDSGKLKTGFENVMYVWVPNFGIKDDNLEFRYKETKYRIKQKELAPKIHTGNVKEIYTVDKDNVIENYPSLSFDTEGYWVKYKSINTNDYSKVLNQEKYGYGPIEL